MLRDKNLMGIKSYFCGTDNPADLLRGQCTTPAGIQSLPLRPILGSLPNMRHAPDCLLCAGFAFTAGGKQWLFLQTKHPFLLPSLILSCAKSWCHEEKIQEIQGLIPN